METHNYQVRMLNFAGVTFEFCALRVDVFFTDSTQYKHLVNHCCWKDAWLSFFCKCLFLSKGKSPFLEMCVLFFVFDTFFVQPCSTDQNAMNPSIFNGISFEATNDQKKMVYEGTGEQNTEKSVGIPGNAIII